MSLLIRNLLIKGLLIKGPLAKSQGSLLNLASLENLENRVNLYPKKLSDHLPRLSLRN